MPVAPSPTDATSTVPAVRVFDFDFDPAFARLGRVFGITPDSARVTIADDRLQARFGPWAIATPLSNVASATLTGPYSTWRTIGPARLSILTHSLTFATNPRQGVEIRFHKPIGGIEPSGRVLHPNLTVTVAGAQQLLDVLTTNLTDPCQ